jgi:hypothetical protein
MNLQMTYDRKGAASEGEKEYRRQQERAGMIPRPLHQSGGCETSLRIGLDQNSRLDLAALG